MHSFERVRSWKRALVVLLAGRHTPFNALAAAAAATIVGIAAIPASAAAGCGSFGNPPGPAPVCNYWKCTADGWIPWPYAAGTLCTAGGQNGVCDGGVIIKGQLEPEQYGQCQVVSTLRVDGKFAIAAVWYAVPGPGSSTTYSNQSQTGTSVSTTSGTGNTFQVGVSGSTNFLGLAGGGYDISYTQAWSQSSTSKMDSLVTYTVDNTMPGPGLDSLDHNYDQIVLLLGPEVVFTGYSLNGALTRLTWAIDSSRAIIYPVQVGWLNGAWGTMPANIAADLYAYGGITAADFPQILGADPYAYDPSGAAQPAPDYFECVEQLYYIPGLPNIEGYRVSNTYASANTNAVSHSYTVRLALSGTWLSQKINASDSWTWSHSSATTNTSTSSVSEQVTLRQPSAGYAGPTVVYVYVDKVYKTLMYSFLPPLTPTAYCQ